jgi:hypothetical protein
MKIILGFLSFIAFAVASALGHTEEGLLAGAAVAAGAIVHDGVLPDRRIKLLDIGTCVLFSALAIFVWTSGATLSIAVVRICVDTGLLLIVLTTIVLGKPFTMDYARPRVDPSLWRSNAFIRNNQVISLAWAAAFAVIILADIALWQSLIPTRAITLIIVGTVYAAMRFTQSFPQHMRQQTALR